MNPIAFIEKRKEKKLNHKDKVKILLDKSDYYIYIEDKGRGGFYEVLLEKIYKKKFEVFDNLGGKTFVIKHYYMMLNNNEITDKKIFLLDRDYEHIFKEIEFESLDRKTFSQLEQERNIKILKRTNIENYLLKIDHNDYESSYERVVNAVRKTTLKKEASIKEILSIENYKEIVNKMSFLSYIFMISLCFNGRFPKKVNHICYNRLCYNDVYNEHLERLKRDFESNKNNYRDLVPYIENMNFEEFLIKFKDNFKKNIDIDMKQLITQLINCIIDRSRKNELETINKLDENALRNFLLLEQEPELEDELKYILAI